MLLQVGVALCLQMVTTGALRMVHRTMADIKWGITRPRNVGADTQGRMYRDEDDVSQAYSAQPALLCISSQSRSSLEDCTTIIRLIFKPEANHARATSWAARPTRL